MPGSPATRRIRGPRAGVPGRRRGDGERLLAVAPGDEAALTGRLRADERCDEGLVDHDLAGHPTSAMRGHGCIDHHHRPDLDGVRVERAA